MNKIQIRILEIFGTLLVGVPFCLWISNLLFFDEGYCIERSFPFFNPIYDLFFEGYHDEPNGYFFILLLILSYGCSKMFIFVLRKLFRF